MKPDHKKVIVIQTCPLPCRLKNVRSFLGLTSHYHKFIPRFSHVAKPLTALTEKDKPFIWDPDCMQAFEALKKALTESQVLDYPPNLDCKFILDVDASDQAIGACLSQVIEGEKIIGTESSPKAILCDIQRIAGSGSLHRALPALSVGQKFYNPYGSLLIKVADLLQRSDGLWCDHQVDY